MQLSSLERMRRRLPSNARPSTLPANAKGNFPPPSEATAPVVMVMVVITGALLGVTLAGEKAQVASAGRPLQANETAWAKPFAGVTVSATVVLPLAATLPLAGVSDKAKVGAGAVMVTVAADETDGALFASPP